MIKTAIILAGGLGKRLRAVVPDLPKPMAMIKNTNIRFISTVMEL